MVISNYYEFIEKIEEEKRKISLNNMNDFIELSKKLDNIRFSTSAEWEEPIINYTVKNLIFNNNNKDRALTLFTMTCWLDLQSKYTTVWTTYLEQLNRWLDNLGRMPRENYKQSSVHLLKTSNLIKDDSVSSWYISSILSIVNENGKSEGNIYRFVYYVMRDLYCSTTYETQKGLIDMEDGIRNSRINGGRHKRLWMLIMFLRRDKCKIKKFFEDALKTKGKIGKKALQYWYDDEYFNEIECELPVDSRIKESWLNLPILKNYTMGESEEKIADSAYNLAKEYDVSPSIFDYMFFSNKKHEY